MERHESDDSHIHLENNENVDKHENDRVSMNVWKKGHYFNRLFDFLQFLAVVEVLG